MFHPFYIWNFSIGNDRKQGDTLVLQILSSEIKYLQRERERERNDQR